MYYDLKFPYRISAEAGLAHDGEGNNDEAYLRLKIGGCKKAITSKQYAEMHEENRHTMAKMLKKKVEWITPISGEEYEANMDDEDE